jgi:Heavy metal associated domain 2
MKHVQIAHQMPGRVRIKVPAARDNPELLEEIQQVFADMPGLKRTRVKPGAGSIVLSYDPQESAAFETRLMQRWKDLPPLMPRKPPKQRELPGSEFEHVTREIEAEAEFLSGHSHLARAIVDFFKQADREIKTLTNNSIDLKIVLAVALAVATFAGIGAAAATPMWVTLALFALNHFIEMQAPGAPGAPRRAASRAAA